LAVGMSNKQIARELGSSPNTVRNQIYAVFRKAGVSNRTELALRVAAAV
jgi:DNA-binding NarL/FixJ family response regulator